MGVYGEGVPGTGARATGAGAEGSQGGLGVWGAQPLPPVPWHHDMTPLHRSGGGRCSQDKAPLAPGGFQDDPPLQGLIVLEPV